MKVLVLYGTRYGTAAEIAEEIGREIEAQGIEVKVQDTMRINETDIDPYDLLVVGSGIKIGKWTKKSLKFLKDNKKALSQKKVAIFVTCGAANKLETRQEGQNKYLDEVAEKYLINKPVATGLFGSKFDPDTNGGLLYKITMRSIKKDLEKQGLDTSQPMDYRNWEEIRSWARKLVALE